jgi:phospholipid/cholesterol/gamma-HCH transport system permease protein|uniref:hypothetical protein n=1 Tax=Orrella sp. TaxID=1921583 RepID=UPI0040486DC0
MTAAVTPTESKPLSDQGQHWLISGRWNVQALSTKGEVSRRQRLLRSVPSSASWAIDPNTVLDSVGAQLLWHRWQAKVPEGLSLTESQATLFEMMATKSPEHKPTPATDSFEWLRRLGAALLLGIHHGRQLLGLTGGLALDFLALLARPLHGPWREISAQVFRAGAQALRLATDQAVNEIAQWIAKVRQPLK